MGGKYSDIVECLAVFGTNEVDYWFDGRWNFPRRKV